MKYKLIKNWENQHLRCYFCGETRSVKYKTEVIDRVLFDNPVMVCVCNKCVWRYGDHPTEKGGVQE